MEARRPSTAGQFGQDGSARDRGLNRVVRLNMPSAAAGAEGRADGAALETLRLNLFLELNVGSPQGCSSAQRSCLCPAGLEGPAPPAAPPPVLPGAQGTVTGGGVSAEPGAVL